MIPIDASDFHTRWQAWYPGTVPLARRQLHSPISDNYISPSTSSPARQSKISPLGPTVVPSSHPARDSYYDAVCRALERDGWAITHDPLRVELAKRKLYVDLGAERVLAEQKGLRKIAVEIKTFGGASEVRDLEDALGQFVLYEHALRREDPDRTLYLAVPEPAWQEVLLDEKVLRVVTFDPVKEELIRWIP